MKFSEIHKLKPLLNDTLPGWEAQRILSPVQTEKYRQAAEQSKKAAVMALMFPNQKGHAELIFIKRPSRNPEDKHSGQISFPGGQREKEDENYKHTALRETHEEIGIPPENIQVLGSLSPLYVYVSNFLVYPFIGVVESKPELTLQQSEVDFVLSEPVHKLVNPAAIQKGNITVRGNTLTNVPHFKLRDEILWGATAMITSELLDLVRKIK